MTKGRQWILTAFFIISSTLCNLAQAANLIAFIAADTYDDRVGASVELDAIHMHEEMKTVAKYTGLNLIEFFLSGYDNNTKNFLNTLKTVNVNTDDVVVFYYAGHGFRTESKGKSPWPNLIFTQEKNGLHKAIQYEYVVVSLMQKHPRLLITITDICNSFMTEDRAPSLVNPLWLSAPKEEKIRANYKHLYCDEKGMINITAASKGEVASGSSETGGVLTTALLKSLKMETQKAKIASWYNLIKRASADVTLETIRYAEMYSSVEEAEEWGEIQHPYFEINTNYSGSHTSIYP